MTRLSIMRWLLGLAWFGCLALLWFRDGFDADALVRLGGMALVGAAGWYIATRIARPLRSYLAVALASACLAGLLFVMHPFIPIALAFWIALTGLGLFWAWYWERTEPLPPAA